MKKAIPIIIIVLTSFYLIYDILLLGHNRDDIFVVYFFEAIIFGVFCVLKMRKTIKYDLISSENRSDSISKSKEYQAKLRTSDGVVGLLTSIYFCVLAAFFVLTYVFVSEGIFEIQINFTNILQLLVILLLGQSVVYVSDYIIGNDYKNADIEKLFSLPYYRLIILSLVIILGSFFGFPVVVLIIMKLAFEIWYSIFEKSKNKF
ncbi:MAG: DUF6498-containing protein [bacterium]|nr:DUF6498-containing protein [bacterium]